MTTTKTQTITTESLIAQHAADIAFAAEEQAATTPEAFVDQLRDASRNLNLAGINGSGELDDAAAYLTDAFTAASKERQVLLNRAAKRLVNTADMVDEYRDMV